MANVIWLLLGSAPNLVQNLGVLVMSLVGCRLFIISLNLLDPCFTFLKYSGIDPTRLNGLAPGQLIFYLFWDCIVLSAGSYIACDVTFQAFVAKEI